MFGPLFRIKSALTYQFDAILINCIGFGSIDLFGRTLP